MSQEIRIEGLAELSRTLEQFTDKLQKAALRSALRAGAQEIRKEAQRLAPVRTGKLRDTIRVGTRYDRRSGEVQATVSAGNRKRGVFYASMVEFGTTGHPIIAGGGTKAGQVLAAGARILGERVDHPGAKPKPFMRPALDTRAKDALEAVRAQLAARIEKLQR